MEFDPKIFDQIKNMDAVELDRKISEISSLLGVDPRMVKRMVGNTDDLQKRIENLNEGDIQRLSRKLDKKTLDEIKRSFE